MLPTYSATHKNVKKIVQRTKAGQIRSDPRGITQWFLKLLETAAPYLDSSDVLIIRQAVESRLRTSP
jgi:hypothetical protein